MKKIIALCLALILVLSMVGCNKGNVNNVNIIDWKPSEIYSDEDIQSAITVNNGLLSICSDVQVDRSEEPAEL